jgi:hypothetical protein
MNAKQRSEWNSRPLFVAVWERCEECGELKQHVQKRAYFTGWTKHETLCCPDCFVELANGTVTC